MTNYVLFFVTLFFLLFDRASKATTHEKLGDFLISRILLESQLTYHENQSGGFEFEKFLATLNWDSKSSLKGSLSIGSQSLISPARWYPNESSDTDLGIVEAYAEWNSLIGKWRLGLVPLPFGLEDAEQETNLILPRSLLYQEKIVNLRNLGLSYNITFREYFTSFSVFNGEIFEELDNQIWLASQWGWGVNTHFQIGIASLVGSTEPTSTNPNGTATSPLGIDNNQHSKIRIGEFFMRQKEKNWYSGLELFVADILQKPNKSQFAGGHFDFTYQLLSDFNIVTRYDQLDFTFSQGNSRKELTLGFSLSHFFKISTLYLLIKKRMDRSLAMPTHEGFIIWQLSPEI